MATGMAIRHHRGDSRQQFLVARQKLPLVDLCEFGEVIPSITDLRPFIRVGGVLIFTLLDELGRIRKGGDQRAAAISHRIAAGMIEMEMRVDDHMNIFRPQAVSL